MITIQAPGELVGAACSTFTDMAAGTLFSVSDVPYIKVTVTGQSPGTGKVFALRLTDGVVTQVTGASKPSVQYVGTYSAAVMSQVVNKTALPLSRKAASTLVANEYFDTSTDQANGDLGLRVTVHDENGSPIAPTAGNIWRFMYTGSAVSTLADATEVDGYDSATAIIHRLVS